MRRPIGYFAVLFVCAASAGAQAVIDNDQVRVLKVTEQPHRKTRPHEHKVNRVMIYLNAGKQEFVEGGKTSYLDFKAGQALWSPARGTHTAESLGAEPFTVIEVELKKEGDPAKAAIWPLHPLKTDPKHYKLEFENSQVRVFRGHFPPGDSGPLHEHTINRVVVALNDQTAEVTTDGKTETWQEKAGEASWGGVTRHSEKNAGAKPLEILVIDLKN